MTKRNIPFKKSSIEKLPDNQPAVYDIQTPSGIHNYIGSAKKGQVQNRLKDHLPGGPDYIPGSKVTVDYTDSVRDARAKEKRDIAKKQPRHNKKGK